MLRRMVVAVVGFLLLGCWVGVAQAHGAGRATFSDETVFAHEVLPHRDSVPLKGVGSDVEQLTVELVVSPSGDVVSARPKGNSKLNRYWPEVEPTVRRWKFRPFERDGMPVTAHVTEYVNLVPPEHLPTHHVPAPVLRRDSQVEISLMRTGCLGSCPSYKVTVMPRGIVVFDGYSFVVAGGVHTATVDEAAVRGLARKFIADDFYSMSSDYILNATDGPSYVLSISIDGDKKKVVDYFGLDVGMPEVIRDLEQEVDVLAGTRRWVDGADGLVAALQGENFDFQTLKAQVILKRAARRGRATTVRDLLEAGVPLHRLASASAKPGRDHSVWMDEFGWLASASDHLRTLQVLMAWGASRYDQSDKDTALALAAQDGDLEAVKALIAYGANPNADLSRQTMTEESAGMSMSGPGDGSVLIYAARSGNPRVVREILRYHPNLEARGPSGQTAMFAAVDDYPSDHYQDRVECVKLLAAAGANVNARDKNGDTPLHETYLTDVERELLKLGANVNARDKDGDAPLFTTVDDAAIPLFIRYGADLSIRNNKGQTVLEATKDNGPIWEAELRKAIAEAKQRQSGSH